jgi:murein DD-endopeptidase MepM/ murein hydrolase activator NlpD
MKLRGLITLLLPAVLSAAPKEETAYPVNYFSPPLDIPMVLSGNFGELRPNHFHTGIDLTTNGAEGLAVRASAEGYVSRIRIGPWGYGRVIYVTHPNGFTTVYGHLSRFNDSIGDYTRSKQYISESFELEFFPLPGELPVRKGDLIAYSGNTGSSGGPHLHFEIRDAKTEEALNPLLFGFPVKDKVPPVILSLVVCPAGPGDIVNGQNGIRRIPLKLSGSKYVFANAADSLVVFGKVGFAIEAYDKESTPRGKNGVYSIKLERESQLIYSHTLARMPFDKSRFINCFIDYEEHEAHNRYYMRSFRLPNNQLPIYDTLVNDGYVELRAAGTHKFRYTVSDVPGNKAVLDFKVRSLAKQPAFKDVVTQNAPFSQVLLWDSPNVFEEDNAYRFETPAGAFYENGIFVGYVQKAKGGLPTIKLGDPYFPIQKECTLTVYADIEPRLQAKALLIKLNGKGGRSAAGGSWTGKGVTATIKEFGTYSIAFDSTAPRITPSNFDLKGKQQSDLSALSAMRFTISDNFSGIASFRGMIDGKWVLMDYEPKKNLLWHTFDERTAKGQHEFILEVTDKCGNRTTYKKTFRR